MADNNWNRTDSVLPAEGVVVDAIDSGGHVQPLKRMGRLWFFPDGSMYVHFAPTFWRPTSTVAATGERMSPSGGVE